jgi:hypothetical protein
MNLSHIRTYLNEQDRVPAVGSSEYEKWLEFTDILEFLIRSDTGQVPVYLSTKSFNVFLYSVLVPKYKLKGNYVENLLGWNFSVSSGWGYGYGFDPKTRKPYKKRVCPPMHSTGSQILEGAEPIFFLRDLRDGEDSYLEINQKFAHLLGIHRDDRRRAYCKVAETGDLEDTVTFSRDEGILCAVDRRALDFYLFLTNTVLVRVFDIQRFVKGSFNGWHEERETAIYTDKRNEVYASRTTQPGKGQSKQAGYLRGIQIIRNKRPDDEMFTVLTGKDRDNKEYASFVAFDWKHRKVHECSCDPEKLGNYFVASDLPFGISPAFFNPEVIAKYKQDTDKYRISNGYITCRGAWSLRFDTNDEEQIQVYLIDLSHLPYKEQLYWKSFNEEPKAGISERVFKRDFEASWDLPHDPLVGLKQILVTFPLASYNEYESVIWRLASGKKLDTVTYVMTDSTKEWEDQILALAKVMAEGFAETAIRKVARYLGCDNPEYKSIVLLKTCLEKKGVDAETVYTINEPLKVLWKLRSSIAAHVGGSVPNENLKLHYRKMIEDCEKSMSRLAEVIRAGYLNVP